MVFRELVKVFYIGYVPAIPTVLNTHQNLMYQWVFRKVVIPGTKEWNGHQTSVHADRITSSYSLSYACVRRTSVAC